MLLAWHLLFKVSCVILVKCSLKSSRLNKSDIMLMLALAAGSVSYTKVTPALIGCKSLVTTNLWVSTTLLAAPCYKLVMLKLHLVNTDVSMGLTLNLIDFISGHWSSLTRQSSSVHPLSALSSTLRTLVLSMQKRVDQWLHRSRRCGRSQAVRPRKLSRWRTVQLIQIFAQNY